MSSLGWVDQVCRSLLERKAPRIVQGLEPYGLRAVFLGGSAVFGEAVGWDGAEPERVLLSDLDLGAVVLEPVPMRLVRDLVASEPALTLGCYQLRFLGRQAPTPGLVDLAAEGHVLWGDPLCLSLIRVPEPASIPPWEAYRLLGNRCLELDSAEAAGGVRHLYALAKAATDLWTSWTVAMGAYRSGWRERWASLDQNAMGAPEEVLMSVRALRAFRMNPSSDKLSCSADGAALFAAGLRAWLEADPGRFRRAGRCPEDSLLREPAGLRSRLQRWRSVWGRPGLPLFALRAAREGAWRVTPDGVLMAEAARRLMVPASEGGAA